MEVDYVTTKETCRITGFKAPTLRGWSNVGKVKTTRTLANQWLYDRQSLLSFIDGVNDGIEKEKIIYCRVSSKKQSEHLEHQIEFCKQYYPDHTVITGISSGINFNRKGIQTVLESAMHGDLEELVVAYKDRLCRFGYELIEWIVGRYG
ncbi:putative resolvase [Heterosigma akashiwo virus 01]|uniref:Putative resolvase n=1 Tax=Heterosigma akashiwo virus 01 TaxID=97195 RepID=A0A1C9C5F2_HAV01|nr:transposase [Heterosigma akashiwo virus 01]AOM63513.1 putative resolvase [Heterosigma akashiwo virus 01]